MCILSPFCYAVRSIVSSPVELILTPGFPSGEYYETPSFRSYYELAAASLRFKFPNPGPLDGITSTTKNILTMRNCGFQYPGSPKPQVQGASLKLCLASRVGVTGVNGAGKTTLIKMVVRETEPQEGEVGKEMNDLRCLLRSRDFQVVRRDDLSASRLKDDLRASVYASFST